MNEAASTEQAENQFAWRPDERFAFPPQGRAFDLPDDRTVFVGTSMGQIGIQFIRPCLIESQHHEPARLTSEQSEDGKTAVSIILSMEAARALCLLLIEELNSHTPTMVVTTNAEAASELK